MTDIKAEIREETIQDIQNYLEKFNKEMVQQENGNNEKVDQEDEEEEEEVSQLFRTEGDEERIFFTDENDEADATGEAQEGTEINLGSNNVAETGEMSYVLIVQPNEGEDGQVVQEGEIGVYEFEDHDGEGNKATNQVQEVEEEGKKFLVSRVPPRRSSGLDLHTCTYCSYATPKKYLLTRHIKSHSDERPHKCSVCERGFKTQASLQNHVNTHTGTKPHRCKYCEAAFTTSGELVRHIRYRHTLEKPHHCTECDYSSVELSKLKRHMRCHTGERPYQCPHCTYASPDTFKLKRHLRIHTGEKPYECDICLARFTQSNSLKSHKNIHSGNKPVYQCQLCPATCGRKTDLRIHIQKLHTAEKPLHSKTHEGEKCHRCELCPYASYSARHLENHMLTHSDEKPFRCDLCNQSFRQKQLLKRHINLYHDPNYTPPVPAAKDHQCPVCMKSFRHRGNLLRHIEGHQGQNDTLSIQGQPKTFKVEVPEEVDQLMAVEGQDGQQYVVLEVIELQEGEEEEDEEEEELVEDYGTEKDCSFAIKRESFMSSSAIDSQSEVTGLEETLEETEVNPEDTTLSGITEFDSMLEGTSRAERIPMSLAVDLAKERDNCFGFDDDEEQMED
ncbi:transcriptional repressor CTCF-like isoform X2 [Artemia franciscana]|uniref:C2H2-type domain-containing protein n=1 Tax=Artemia franciscana TaxID=6661 RepID=A0AA88LCJ3_ARTSF|nr:hypothetical protein QYM36_000700 [Artemia franciscana]KAK2726345.1 hypothetical protein QYM36_000700 [Artemia franciscana]